MGWLNSSIARWQTSWWPLWRNTSLSGKGTYRRYVLHTIPVCMHQQDRPFFLMFGRWAQLPLDLVFQYRCDSADDNSGVCCWLEMKLKSSLQEGVTDHWCQTVSAEATLQQMSAWGHTTVLSRRNAKKFHHPYTWTGPYRVIKRLSDSTYRIQLLGTSQTTSGSFQSVETLWWCRREQSTSRWHQYLWEPVPKSPVTGSGLDVVEPEDNPAWSKPHQTSPPVPPLPQSHLHQRWYPARNRQPPDRFSDPVSIWECQ